MAILPTENSKEYQFILRTPSGVHDTFSVFIKGSDVFVQPTVTPALHISLHHEEGSKRRKNCHFRIESSYSKKFNVSSNNTKTQKSGKLVDWNRKLNETWDCPLELVFVGDSVRKVAEVMKDRKNIYIDYREGAIILNFWFTNHSRETIENQSDEIKLLLYEKIPLTGENFALTYINDTNTNRFTRMVETREHFEIKVNSKEPTEYKNTINDIKFTFGLTPESKKTIIFH